MGCEMEVRAQWDTALRYNAFHPDLSRIALFEMQSACHARQGNRDAGLLTMNLVGTARDRREGIFAVHPDCVADNTALLWERLYCTCAGLSGDSAGEVRRGMTNSRDSISRRANRFLCTEKISRGLARDVRELRYTCADDRAGATATSSAECSAGRIDYITSSYKNVLPGF